MNKKHQIEIDAVTKHIVSDEDEVFGVEISVHTLVVPRFPQ